MRSPQIFSIFNIFIWPLDLDIGLLTRLDSTKSCFKKVSLTLSFCAFSIYIYMIILTHTHTHTHKSKLSLFKLHCASYSGPLSVTNKQ